MDISERDSQSSDPGHAPVGSLFTPGSPQARSLPVAIWGVAGLIVLVIVAGLFVAGRRHAHAPAGTILPLDPYASHLPISSTVMSESVSLSGGKSTFVDGHIQNTGPKSVTGIRVQVFFRNEEGMPPYIETLPLALVRTREPYVDTEQVSADPLKSGDSREFRLIFETIPGSWDTQMPEIHVIGVTLR